MNLKKVFPLILLIILCSGLFLRFWGITSESYWLDEAVSVKQAQMNYGTTLEMVKDDVHLPLYFILLNFWIKLFGISELGSRSLSLIFGVFSIFMIYLLAKKMFSLKVALIASALMSVSPIMIYYSQESRPYSLFVLLTLISFYFFACFVEKNEDKYLLAYLFFSLLLIYTHLFSFLVIIVQNVYLLYISRFKLKKLMKWFYCQFTLFLLFTPWIPIIISQIKQTLFTEWIPKPTISIVLKTFVDFFGNTLNLLILIFVFAMFVQRKKFKSGEKNKLILLLIWSTLSFVIVIVYSTIFPSDYNTRYLLFTLPAIIILFSFFISNFTETNKIFGYALLVIVILSSLFSVMNQVERTDKDDWRAASEYVKQNIKQDEIILIAPFYQQEPFSYYYDNTCFKSFEVTSCNFEKHKILSFDWSSKCCTDNTKVTATDGRDLIRYYLNKKIWLISVRPELYGSFEKNSLLEYFNVRKNMTLEKDIGDIKIYKFE